MQTITRTTPCGALQGLELEDHLEYRGIRYATARRWEYPRPVEHWEGIYDATQFGACCYQHRGFDEDSKVNPFYSKEFRVGCHFTYSEDCQYLNIWAPKDAKDCPVLIYIHGGSFTGGSTDERHISGTAYAKKGVIFVAMNYRLGPYGFCAHPQLKEADGTCGNYGLYDQLGAPQHCRPGRRPPPHNAAGAERRGDERGYSHLLSPVPGLVPRRHYDERTGTATSSRTPPIH